MISCTSALASTRVPTPPPKSFPLIPACISHTQRFVFYFFVIFVFLSLCLTHTNNIVFLQFSCICINSKNFMSDRTDIQCAHRTDNMHEHVSTVEMWRWWWWWWWYSFLILSFSLLLLLFLRRFFFLSLFFFFSSPTLCLQSARVCLCVCVLFAICARII